MLTEHRYESFAELQKALLDWSQDLLQQALEREQAVSMLLSGGSTPLPYYRELAKSTLPWDRIHLALVDERWVDVNDISSNERAIREAFAPNAMALRNFTGMKSELKSAAVDDCNARYARLPWPPTLCVLGLGADGHTASLFPEAMGLHAALHAEQFCAAINAQPTVVTGNCTERMTMTLWALLQARHIAFVFTGPQKLKVYEAVSQREDLQIPASFVVSRAKSLDVFYCVD